MDAKTSRIDAGAARGGNDKDGEGKMTKLTGNYEQDKSLRSQQVKNINSTGVPFLKSIVAENSENTKLKELITSELVGVFQTKYGVDIEGFSEYSEDQLADAEATFTTKKQLADEIRFIMNVLNEGLNLYNSAYNDMILTLTDDILLELSLTEKVTKSR